MFKSSKKLDDPPKVMSKEEIQEDLLTFCKASQELNKSQILAELKEEEINLNQWWDAFQLYKTQISQMEKLKERLNDIKGDLTNHQKEVEVNRDGLKREMDDNIKRLNQIKTPK